MPERTPEAGRLVGQALLLHDRASAGFDSRPASSRVLDSSPKQRTRRSVLPWASAQCARKNSKGSGTVRFEACADTGGHYRWRLWSGSNKVASSGESVSKYNAERTATLRQQPSSHGFPPCDSGASVPLGSLGTTGRVRR